MVYARQRMSAGRTLGGRYVLRAQLGRGGMGEVYEADDLQLDRRVAVKLLTGVSDERDLERFRREARSAARLTHPNVVQVYELALPEGEEPAYLVMERLVGEPLSALVARDAPFAPARALRIARQIASGLAAAHEAGIIHRDIKPSNVILLRGSPLADHVKVVDFGLARDVDANSVTTSGVVLGTVTFMAPEQAMGAKLGPPCDVWATGVVLYQMLTKALPHKSTVPGDIIAGLYRGDLVPLRARAPSLPARVLAIVERATTIDLDARYPSARQLLEDLERACDEVGDDVPPARAHGSAPQASSGPDLSSTVSEQATTRAASRGAPRARREEERRAARSSVWARSAAITCAAGAALGGLAIFVARRGEPVHTPPAPATRAQAEGGAALPSADDATPLAADAHGSERDTTAAITPPPGPRSTPTQRSPSPAPSASVTASREDDPSVPITTPDAGGPRSYRAHVVSSTWSGMRSRADDEPDRAKLGSLKPAAQRCLTQLVMPACDDGNFSVNLVIDVDTRSGRVTSGDTPAPACRVRRHEQRFGIGGFAACMRPAILALELGPTRSPTVSQAKTRLHFSFQFLQDD